MSRLLAFARECIASNPRVDSALVGLFIAHRDDLAARSFLDEGLTDDDFLLGLLTRRQLQALGHPWAHGAHNLTVCVRGHVHHFSLPIGAERPN